MKGGGHAFAALSVGSRAVGKRKTLAASAVGRRKQKRRISRGYQNV
jgi:hypothetical protein